MKSVLPTKAKVASPPTLKLEALSGSPRVEPGLDNARAVVESKLMEHVMNLLPIDTRIFLVKAHGRGTPLENLIPFPLHMKVENFTYATLHVIFKFSPLILKAQSLRAADSTVSPLQAWVRLQQKAG